MALARRGMSMLSAKRAVEAVMEVGKAVVRVPRVEADGTLLSDLMPSGLLAARIDRNTPDVRAIRDRLRLTREQFSVSYGIPEETLRKWESGERNPDGAARSYLIAISNDPRRRAGGLCTDAMTGELTVERNERAIELTVERNERAILR